LEERSSEELLTEIWERARGNWHRPPLPRPRIGAPENGEFPFQNYHIKVGKDDIEKGALYLENLFDHLIAHYIFCPRSLETAANLALAALQGLEKPKPARAREMVNLFSDIVVDTFRLKRSEEDEEKVFLGWKHFAERGDLSSLDEVVLGFLGQYWDLDISSSNRPESEKLLEVFGWGVSDRSKWPRQCQQMARILEPLEPGVLGQGEIPSQEGLRGSANVAPLLGLASDLEPDEYRDCLSVLGIDGNLKRWYRDQSYSIVIRPSIRPRESWYPAGLIKWRFTDPPSELDVPYSLSLAPKLIPGVTTYRREHECCEMMAGSQEVPDLLVVLDSSGSMGGHDRGTKTHAATLAAFKASQFAHSQGAELAAINFSDRLVLQDWTRDLGAVEDVLVQHLGSRTHIPGEEILKFAKNRKGSLILCITDTHIQNLYREWDLVEEASRSGQFVLFCIDEANKNRQVEAALKSLGAVYYINRPEDLISLVVDTTEEAYRTGRPICGETFISEERMGEVP